MTAVEDAARLVEHARRQREADGQESPGGGRAAQLAAALRPLEDAARHTESPVRAAEAADALRAMVAAGLDTSTEQAARTYATKNKLMNAKAFDAIVKAEREQLAGRGGEQSDPDAPNQASRLIGLARAHYRLIRTDDGEAYGVRRDGPNVALTIGRGGAFGNHLIRLFYEAEGRAPSDDAERTTVKILRAYLDDDDPQPVYLRVAPYGNHEGIVLDLGTADGACVIVTAAGWDVRDRSPVAFRRAAGLPLPLPARSPAGAGDGLARLRRLVNISDDHFALGVAWLVAALIPEIPHPIMLPRGEQGSAKTTISRIFQRIIDPSGLKPGVLPRDERDFAVRMTNSYVQAFDNVSNVPPWISDALCRAATGDSFVSRTLYTDRDVTILQYSRPIILNTIDAGALASDLVDRSMMLDLERIAPENRRAERAAIGDDPDANPGLYDQLDKDHPYILGAILDLVADVFRTISGVRVDSLPRMADFGKILAALDKCQEWKTASNYAEMVASETGALVENSPFASRVVVFMSDREEWQGTATELLDALAGLLPDRDRPPRGWPADATRAGGQLMRFAPSLRVQGVEVERDRVGNARKRVYKLRKLASAASAASATRSEQAKHADASADARSDADARRTLASASPDASVRMFPQVEASADAADAADASFRKDSGLCAPSFADGTPLPPEPTESDDWPASETGPCRGCGRPTHLYGEHGRTLCAACSATRPTPANMPKRQAGKDGTK